MLHVDALCSPLIMADGAKRSKVWDHFVKWNANAATCNIFKKVVACKAGYLKQCGVFHSLSAASSVLLVAPMLSLHLVKVTLVVRTKSVRSYLLRTQHRFKHVFEMHVFL